MPKYPASEMLDTCIELLARISTGQQVPYLDSAKRAAPNVVTKATCVNIQDLKGDFEVGKSPKESLTRAANVVEKLAIQISSRSST
jgi:hypothetical protein